MSEASTWAPHDIDLERPSVARMYDYLLGGAHNFAVDRAAVDRAVTALPWLPLVAYANRDFLRRAVLYMAAEGISQFLDLGSGPGVIPAADTIFIRAHAIYTGPNAATPDQAFVFSTSATAIAAGSSASEAHANPQIDP